MCSTYPFMIIALSSAYVLSSATASALRPGIPDTAGYSTPTYQIEDATTSWVRAVTEKNNPRLVTDQFCSDGILWGTVSQSIRGGASGGGNEVGGDIERYFDFFAKIPGIRVKKAEDNIQKVTSNVYVNNANVKWFYDGLEEPLNARMTFIYRRDASHSNGWCIFELHSSSMPDMNADLKAISDQA